VDCPDELKFKVVEQVRRDLGERGKLTTIDGVRVTYSDGAWALVRASNTGPVIVLRFEAPSLARLDELRRDVESTVQRARGDLEARG
jgi:phosphomannomutase/phosphoglucomutase